MTDNLQLEPYELKKCINTTLFSDIFYYFLPWTNSHWLIIDSKHLKL
jgi:hypothetical protein